MKLPVSVVIITKNEEDRIEDAIKSVEWADEIIIVDDESTDNTVDLCKQLGTKVFSRKMDIEGRHRNWAYSQASNEWVLSLDADERAEPNLKDEIQQRLEAKEPYNGYTIPRKNMIGNFWIEHGGWYPSAQLKLFKKDQFKWEEVEVHPRAFMEGERPQLSANIIHYTYRNFSDALKKVDAQTTLEAKKWFQEKRKITLGKCMWKTFDRFMRAYVRKKGYKDGYIGFVMAVFGGLYQVLSYAKYQEMLGEK